jgi:chromosome segregation ATPase
MADTLGRLAEIMDQYLREENQRLHHRVAHLERSNDRLSNSIGSRNQSIATLRARIFDQELDLADLRSQIEECLRLLSNYEVELENREPESRRIRRRLSFDVTP